MSQDPTELDDDEDDTAGLAAGVKNDISPAGFARMQDEVNALLRVERWRHRADHHPGRAGGG